METNGIDAFLQRSRRGCRTGHRPSLEARARFRRRDGRVFALSYDLSSAPKDKLFDQLVAD